jgi:hypothetical protein
MLIPRNVVPRGLPMCRSVWVLLRELSPCPLSRDVFRRKSCVTAMPIDAKLREVRSHARNVRSWRLLDSLPEGTKGEAYRLRGDLGQRCLCSPALSTGTFLPESATTTYFHSLNWLAESSQGSGQRHCFVGKMVADVRMVYGFVGPRLRYL